MTLAANIKQHNKLTIQTVKPQIVKYMKTHKQC